jgi:WD40 repeat protein
MLFDVIILDIALDPVNNKTLGRLNAPSFVIAVGGFKLTSSIQFAGHAFNVVTCLQFDSEKIVSGSDDHNIHVYTSSNGRLMRKLEGHE